MDPTHEPRTAPGDPPVETQPASDDAAVTKPATPDCDTNEGSESSKGESPQARNNLRHGLRSGMLPKGAEYIRRQCADWRSAVEDAVLTLDGSITVYSASLIQSAVSHLRHALLCRKWLKDSFATLSHGERLAYSRDITRALDSRDRVLRELKLNRTQGDAVTILYEREADDDPSPE